MQRLSSWLIVLLAVAVFAAAGYVITKNDPVPDAGTVLSVPGTSAPLSSGSAPSSGGASGKVIAFLGDDWTAGVGASTKAKRFTSLLADRLGATEKNFGTAGSGYAKAPDGSTDSAGGYAARVDDVVDAEPDVVIVAGGRNDISDDVGTLRSRVKALFADLHKRLPRATLIALAPMWGDSDSPAALKPVAKAVQQYVDDADGTYVELDDPVHDHPEYMTDLADPNDKGYAAIATALAPKIRSLLS